MRENKGGGEGEGGAAQAGAHSPKSSSKKGRGAGAKGAASGTAGMLQLARGTEPPEDIRILRVVPGLR